MKQAQLRKKVSFIEDGKAKENSEFNFSMPEWRAELTRHFEFNHFNVLDFNYDVSGLITIGATLVDNILYYALAMCSPNDNFSRKVGRNFVLKHMIGPDSTKRGLFKVKEEHLDDDVGELMQDAIQDWLDRTQRVPTWIKKTLGDFGYITLEYRRKRKETKVEVIEPSEKESIVSVAEQISNSEQSTKIDDFKYVCGIPYF